MTIREDDLLEIFNPRTGDIVLDIGAHSGRYSIICSKRVGPTGKVISIEPDIESFELLKRNLKLNKLENAVPINCALHSDNIMAKLYTSKNPSEHAIYHSTMLERAQSDDLYVSVKAYTLDSLLPEYGIDSFDCKVDKN